MKKVLLTVLMLIALSFASQAQTFSKNALGLRLGDNNGFGGEISYQRGLSKSNRLELDLGWRNSNNYDAVKITGIYQWVWNIEGGFNWYAGVGGGLGFWDYNYDDKFEDDFYDDDSGVYVFAAGDIGIEYDFEQAPIQISLDLRPEIGFNNYDDDEVNFDIGLGVRYRF